MTPQAAKPSRSERGAGGARADDQRRRLIDALAKCCAAKGYVATTIQDVVARAGTSKRTFYRHFADKEACYDAAIEQFVAEVDAAMPGKRHDDPRDGEAWPDRVRERMAALLAQLEARPPISRLAFLEGGPGPGAEAAASELLLGLAFAAGDSAELPAEVPESAKRAALGGARALVADQLAAERSERLAELLPELVYITLVPYVGQEEAVRQSDLAAAET